MSEVKMVQGSIEYLYADIRADRVLDTQAVAMCVTPDTTPSTASDAWRSAAWTGPVGKYRSARILVDGDLPRGLYNVFARITDMPEAPIIPVGKLRVT
jgi:hypothetical protein